MKNIGIRTWLLVRAAGLLLWQSAVGGAQHIQPARPGPGGRDLRERGDVPGWVMITLVSSA